jgi:hypothetical protein
MNTPAIHSEVIKGNIINCFPNRRMRRANKNSVPASTKFAKCSSSNSAVIRTGKYSINRFRDLKFNATLFALKHNKN